MSFKVMLTQDEFLKKLKEKDIKYIPLEEYKGTHTKINWMCYRDSNHIFMATPHNIVDGGSNCPYCKNRKISIRNNDLWTTHPDVANMLKDKKVGYERSYGSSYKTDWICPNCGKEIKNRSIYYVVTMGLQCENCIAHISYPERLMSTFLSQLNLSYVHDKSTSWSDRKRYDFYIESHNTIIECHGSQHYIDKGWGKNYNLDKQIEIDEYKKQMAMSNGIEHYIQLNCEISDFDYIKKSILNSEINRLFNLECFDWELCKENIIDNGIYTKVLNCTKNGLKTVIEISDSLGISDTTVRRYLHRLTEDGLFNYSKEAAKQNNKDVVCKKVICLENQKIYNSMTEGSVDTNCTVKGISDCCRGVITKHKNLHWMYYNDYLLMNKEAKRC